MYTKKNEAVYFDRLELLFYKGLSERKIISFDDEFYDKMKNLFTHSALPVSMEIKYLKPPVSLGRCYDRSLYMFFCFKESLLVRGCTKDLELKYGKDNASHGWIEIGDYVYDPTHLMKFEKKLYYEMFKPTEVKKYNHEQYKKNNSEFYDDIMATTIEDFKPGGKKRSYATFILSIIEANAKQDGNDEFLKELNAFFKLIQYEEKEVKMIKLSKMITELLN